MLDYLAMLDYLDMLESTKYFGILPNIPQIFYQIFVPGYWAPSLSAAKLFTAPDYSCFVYPNPLFFLLKFILLLCIKQLYDGKICLCLSPNYCLHT